VHRAMTEFIPILGGGIRYPRLNRSAWRNSLSHDEREEVPCLKAEVTAKTSGMQASGAQRIKSNQNDGTR